MANSITGLDNELFLDIALESFCAAITPLSAFSLDASSAATAKGKTVVIPRASTADAATTKSGDYSVQDADSDTVELTMPAEPTYVSWGLTDSEIANAGALSMELYAKQKGFQLAKKVLQDIWGEITNANFGAAAFTGAAGTFDADDVVDIRTACTNADMPNAPRALVLDVDYYGALLKDGAIQSSDAFGSSQPVQGGTIPQLSGFSLYESNLIPANGENLVGFAAHPSAIAIAMRYLEPQEGHKYNEARPLVGEGGITIGYRDWYDENAGQRKRVLEVMHAWETAIGAGIKRIVSA